MATLTLPAQGEPRRGRGRPPGPKKLAMMAQEAPMPRILRAREQLNKRVEILEQIKKDQWVELMIDVPLNSLTIDVVQGRGYETKKLPPQHVDRVARSVAIGHFTPLVNLQREEQQLCLIETGFSIYFQFGMKYMTDERCEWLLFKSKWKRSIEKFDRAFEKKEATEEKYCDGVIRSYQQLGRFLKTYRNKLLEERVNLEYKKWLASAKLTLPLEEENYPKDHLGRETVCVLHENGWSFGLPENTASHAIRKYMEKWPASAIKQSGEHYNITSGWIRTTCQNSLKIFGRNPSLRGQEAPAGPERDSGASGNEEESFIASQVAEEDQEVQEVPRRLEGFDIFANFEWQTSEEMVENRDATTPKFDEQANSPLQAQGSSKPSDQGEAIDGSEVSTSRQTQDNSTATRAAEGGQAMKKSSSSQPLMLPHLAKGDGDGEKTPPKKNGDDRKGKCNEEGDGQVTENEDWSSIYADDASKKCPHAELASTPQAVSNTERTPSQALPGPSVQGGSVQETTLGSVSMSPGAPRTEAGPSMNDLIRDVAPGDSSQQQGTVLGIKVTRPTLGQRPQSMNSSQTSLLEEPQSSAGTSQNARSEPIRGFFSNDATPGEINTEQSSTSTSGKLRISRPRMGQRPANMNAWQADLPGGLEGAEQRTMQRLRSREGSRASQTPVPPTFAPINSAQVGFVPSNQGLGTANGSFAQGQSNTAGAGGSLRKAAPMQRGVKRPASSQGDGRPAQRPRGPNGQTPWTEPYRMPQYPRDPVQAPVSGMMGARLSRGNPNLTDDAYAREWAKVYEQNGLKGQLGNMNAMGRSVTPMPVGGYGSNMGAANGQSSFFAMPGTPTNSYNTMGFSPLPNHQMNQMGNFQNRYSSSNYMPSQMPTSSSQYPPTNGFANPPPQMNQQTYTDNQPTVQQRPVFDPAIQAGFQPTHAQYRVQVPNMMLQSFPSTMPHAMQQSAYGPAMTSSVHDNGHSSNARGPSQTPQPPNWQQPQNIAPQQAGEPKFQGAPGMSTQPMMMNEEHAQQAQFVSLASPDSVPSQGLNQASRSNSSRSHSGSQSNGSTNRRSTGSSGEQSGDTGHTNVSSTASTTPPNGNSGMHSQISSRERGRLDAPNFSIDSQTGKIKRKVGRPSKAQLEAEAEAFAEAERERETRAFEAELEQHLLSERPYRQNRADLVFTPELAITQLPQQLWSVNSIPVPQDVATCHINQTWNVTMDGSQVLGPAQAADAPILPRPFPQAVPFPVLNRSELLIHAYDVPDETVFADLDFDAGSVSVSAGDRSGNEKFHSDGPCEGARLDESFAL